MWVLLKFTIRFVLFITSFCATQRESSKLSDRGTEGEDEDSLPGPSGVGGEAAKKTGRMDSGR